MKFIRNKLELAYEGAIINVYKDYLTTPDNKEVVYDLIDHVGAAAVMPIDQDGNIILVKQYRNVLDRDSYEIPAGCKTCKEEDGRLCALRELEEETGFTTKKLIPIGDIMGMIGVSNEMCSVYIATELELGKANPDPEEFLELYHVSLDEALQMVQERKIVDVKTVMAIYAYMAGYGR